MTWRVPGVPEFLVKNTAVYQPPIHAHPGLAEAGNKIDRLLWSGGRREAHTIDIIMIFESLGLAFSSPTLKPCVQKTNM